MPPVGNSLRPMPLLTPRLQCEPSCLPARYREHASSGSTSCRVSLRRLCFQADFPFRLVMFHATTAPGHWLLRLAARHAHQCHGQDAAASACDKCCQHPPERNHHVTPFLYVRAPNFGVRQPVGSPVVTPHAIATLSCTVSRTDYLEYRCVLEIAWNEVSMGLHGVAACPWLDRQDWIADQCKRVRQQAAANEARGGVRHSAR
jgi:hypothetical protein